MRKLLIPAVAGLALTLGACGRAPPDPDADNAERHEGASQDSVFLDTSTLDKARAVEALQEEQKRQIDEAVDSAGR
jgi:hypothetical protein